MELQKKGSKLVNFLILIPKGDTPMSEDLGAGSTDITKSIDLARFRKF